MNSLWQASIICWATLKYFASYFVNTILRPLIPPAALHQLTNDVPTSKKSEPKPGATEAPGSAIVPTLIVVAEMPRPLPPVALPGPQMALRSPKSPLPAETLGVLAADAELLEVFGLVVGPFEGELERPQPVTPTTSAAVVATVSSCNGILFIHLPFKRV